MLPFKSGASVMAIKARVPIVPIMQYKKPKPFLLNHILIGEPFEFTEYYDKKLTDELIREADEKLREKLLEMRREHANFWRRRKGEKKPEWKFW